MQVNLFELIREHLKAVMPGAVYQRQMHERPNALISQLAKTPTERFAEIAARQRDLALGEKRRMEKIRPLALAGMAAGVGLCFVSAGPGLVVASVSGVALGNSLVVRDGSTLRFRIARHFFHLAEKDADFAKHQAETLFWDPHARRSFITRQRILAD